MDREFNVWELMIIFKMFFPDVFPEQSINEDNKEVIK